MLTFVAELYQMAGSRTTTLADKRRQSVRRKERMMYSQLPAIGFGVASAVSAKRDCASAANLMDRESLMANVSVGSGVESHKDSTNDVPRLYTYPCEARHHNYGRG